MDTDITNKIHKSWEYYVVFMDINDLSTEVKEKIKLAFYSGAAVANIAIKIE